MDTREILMDAFERIQQVSHGAAAGLSRSALNFRPDPDANSIGWLVWHLTRIQDHHVSGLAGREQAYIAAGWAERLGMNPDPADLGFGHTSDQVAAVRFDAPDDVLAYHDAVVAHTKEYLATIDADELDRIVDYRWDPPVSAGVRIVSVINDCMQHAGQAAYVRGMFQRLS